jgi:hypothetical protein
MSWKLSVCKIALVILIKARDFDEAQRNSWSPGCHSDGLFTVIALVQATIAPDALMPRRLVAVRLWYHRISLCSQQDQQVPG